jgi:hypothetical protein
MSTAMGIAAVTAVLENLLNGVFNPGAGLGTVKVTAVAPDIIQGTLTANDATLQVNLFLHQVIPNASWRNMGLASLAADGVTRLKNPPLALDLHYLLTTYASADCEAEALLGYAVQFLHENPVLARNDIRNNLGSLPSNPSLSALLAASGLGDQVEMIKITPASLSREEVAWLWTALKADYRPTFPFQVSVVLIQAENPLSSGLPVLERQITALPNLSTQTATITEADFPNGQPAGCLGDVVTVLGGNLLSSSAVVLVNSRVGVQQTITAVSAVSPGSFKFTLPNPAQPNTSDLPAGVYLLSAQSGSGPALLTSNGLPMAIAPKLSAASVPATLASGASVGLTVTCAPYVRAGQEVSLLIGGQEAQAHPIVAPTTRTNTPSFTFLNLQPTGVAVPVRLRVDGIESPSINMTAVPPAFSGPLLTVT